MGTFKLKLREAISQFGDTTLGYVLDWVDMDTNFINLKGNDVDSIALHGNILTITKINGVALTLELPDNIIQNNFVRVIRILESNLNGIGTIQEQICEYILNLPPSQRTILETDSKWNVEILPNSSLTMNII